MRDVSYNIPRLPLATDPLDYQRANDIEYNLLALIKAWPAFEDLTVLDPVGSYGYLDTRDGETASPADGLRVELLQYLPRLIVIFTGDVDKITVSGPGWTQEAPGEWVYQLGKLSGANATAALRVLTIGATGDADITITLAAENRAWEPGGLRLLGKGETRLLFRGTATWNLAKEKLGTWGGARPLTWDGAKELRKG